VPRPMPVGPPLGNRHRFHMETNKWGSLVDDGRCFTKTLFDGRLSVVTEGEVHSRGLLQYAACFQEGELSSADGLGFVFSRRLPCPKNIQKIVSIFVNRSGRICLRAHTKVVRFDAGVKRLEVGDWVSVTIDLRECTAEFTVWPAKKGEAPTSACLAYGFALQTNVVSTADVPSCGYFACVVKNVGVSVCLGS